MLTRSFRGIATRILPFAAVAAAIGLQPAMADYPEKPITLVVGFSAGGGVDTYARTFANIAQDELGVPVVVVNQPGATGMIGAKSVKEAASDGYTLMVIGGGTIYLKSKLDGAEAPAAPDDFVTLGGIGSLTTSLMLPMDSRFDSVQDLIAHAKEHPGELRWANPGNGSIHTMGGKAFLAANGIEAQGVPFKGGGKARVAIAGEQVDFGFVGVQLIAGFENELRALAVTSPTRNAVFPDVPTMEDLGLPQLTVSNPVVVYGQADLPGDVVATLREAIRDVATSETYKEAALTAGSDPTYLTVDEFDAAMESLAAAVAPMLGTPTN